MQVQPNDVVAGNELFENIEEDKVVLAGLKWLNNKK